MSTFVRFSNKRMQIAILGYGKMGKVIEEIALKRGHSIPLKVNLENLDFDSELLGDCDVAIEFSSPESAVENINKCFDANIPVVVGTTGWYSEFDAIQERCIAENKGLLHATNFSIGVNIFYEINKKLAALMDANSQYDVAVEETHHTQKMDAPSGTAITIAEGIIANLDRKVAWKNEINVSEDELAIESIRTEDVPGTHIVKYTSDIDVIEIKHEAKNRNGFAFGAVLAAEYMNDKEGVFTMKDVLSL
jgi:4-hydroxy-tetrahydrodipicolinate reductase